VQDLDDLTSQGMYMHDLPLWDASRDLILLAEQRRVESGLVAQVSGCALPLLV
jgi:hypothetical protein